MGLFDFLKRKPKPEKTSMTKEDVYKAIFEKLAQQPPSRHFVAGSVFDFVRKHHEFFESAMATEDLRALQIYFIKGYQSYLDNPQAFGAMPGTVDKNNNDTNPLQWNMSIVPLTGTDKAFLCFMPVQGQTHSARIFSIATGSRGDGYYYCMLNKDENEPAKVIRNKASAGIETIGTVQGRGFELMDQVKKCIRNNYYKKAE